MKGSIGILEEKEINKFFPAYSLIPSSIKKDAIYNWVWSAIVLHIPGFQVAPKTMELNLWSV